MILLIGSVSALEWDNGLIYEKDDLFVRIENGYFFGIGEWFGLSTELGSVELKSHSSVNEVLQFGYGKEEVVMYYDFTNWELYKNGLGEVYFTDMKTGEVIEKNFTFVEWVKVNVTKNKYEDVCILSENKTNICERKIVGTYLEEEYKWVDYVGKDIPDKNTRIGLKTYVGNNDYMDAVWTIAGMKLKKHASWTADLNVGLNVYYNFDETSGTTLDEEVNHVQNGTTINMTNANWVTGILGNALNFSREDKTLVNITDTSGIFSSNQTSISFWFYPRTNWSTTQVFWGGSPSNKNYFTTGVAVWQLKMYNDDVFSLGPLAADAITPWWSLNNWHHIVIIADNSGTNQFWADGISRKNSTNTWSATNSNILHLGQYVSGLNGLNAYMDELSVWNRTLSGAEITQLYNSGAGITFQESFVPTFINNAPVNTYNSTNLTVIFNKTVSDETALINVTLYIDGVLNETNSSGINDVFYIFTKDISIGSHNWTYEACDSTSCSEDIILNFTIRNFIENSYNFNSLTYETEQEALAINISTAGITPTSASLIYNGTEYTGATVTSLGSNNFNISKTITILASTGTKAFHFNFTIDAIEYNTISNNQIVSRSILALCNSTFPYPYVNFTFLDEETLTSLNATIDASTWSYWLGDGTVTKSFLYSNTTENDCYAFCFSGGNRTMHNTRDIQYASAGYPQRRYTASSDLTNSTTNKIFYLLSSADGIYTTIQVVDGDGDKQSGVEVTIERQFSGTWTIVGQGTTDDSGAVTFWVNPDYDHRLTFISDDCTDQTVTIRPTQTQYTQSLQCDGVSDFVSSIEGIKYYRSPKTGIIQTGLYNFTYQVVSSKDNIINASFQLVNTSNSVVLNSTSSTCALGGCTLLFLYEVKLGDDFKGKYYVDIGNGNVLLEGDAHWVNVQIDTDGKSGAKTLVKDWIYVFQEWGDDSNTADFNRLVTIFFFLCLLISFLNFHLNMDTSNPGAFLSILTAIILIGSLAGETGAGTSPGLFYFNNLSSSVFLNNYILAFICLIISGSYWLNTNRIAQR